MQLPEISLPSELTEDLGTALNVTDVVALEKRIEAAGTPLFELMNRAGLAATQAICTYIDALNEFGEPKQVCKYAHANALKETDKDRTPAPIKRACILCGSGNNGGDGWVVARLLAERGWTVSLVTKRTAAEISAEPARSAALQTSKDARELAGQINFLVNPTIEEVTSALDDANVVVDAVLGTGFDGASIKEPYGSWIAIANERTAKGDALAVAVDCPSGLSAQSGSLANPTFRADVTVTMIATKRGLVAPTSASVVGKLLRAPLGNFAI